MDAMAENNTFICNERNTINLSNVTLAEEMIVTDGDVLSNALITPSLGLLGIVGNLVFLFTILRLSDTQSGLNTYLCHLAVSDVFFLAVALYWLLQGLFSTRVLLIAHEIESNFGCAVYVFSVYIWYFVSIELNTVITVERYFAICVPLRHRLMVGRKRTVTLLLCVWVSAIVASLTIIPSQFVASYNCLTWPQQSEFNDLPMIVPVCVPMNAFWEYYGILMMFALFLLTFVITSVLHIKIIMTLTQRSSIIAKTNDEDANQEPQIQNMTFQQEADKVRNQVAKTLIASCIIYFITQTPYRLTTLEILLDKTDHGFLSTDQFERLDMIGNAGLFLNSIINPYFYFGSCRYYRNALRRLYTCKWRCFGDV